MCYDDQARPPIPPESNGSAQGEDIVLTAADGNRFAAYLAQPDRPAKARLLIYPDIRGLHQFYKELALRFAEAGIAAVAMDYFGRTAGLTPRDDTFVFRPHVEQLQLRTILADAQAALAYVRSIPANSEAAFTLGFCLGGTVSLYTGTEMNDLAGVIAFYAGMSRVLEPAKGTALEAAPEMRVPVLGLFGGADQGIPEEQVEALDRALDTAGVTHEVIIYPGAPHSFFDRRASEYADASTDAWRRVLGFIAEHAST
jgi:carboxymethylenebutenolidase